MNDTTALTYAKRFLNGVQDAFADGDTDGALAFLMILAKVVDRDCRHAACEVAPEHQGALMNLSYGPREEQG